MSKKFYRFVRKEYMNNNEDYPMSVYYGPIQYGELPTSVKCDVYINYDELVKAIKNNPAPKEYFTDLYLSKHFNKYTIYSRGKAWVEEGAWFAGKIYRKEFKSYSIKEEYDPVQVSVKRLLEEVPIEVLLEWAKDKNIKLSDIINKKEK